MLDGRSTSAALGGARIETAVFGIGAIEQHGRHLPIATDWTQVKEISRRVAEALGALLLPAIPFSMSECHGPMGGTVWLKPATLSAVLRDVAASLRSQGVHRLLVLNGHGGNFILEPTIQALNQDYPTLRVVMPAEVWAPVPGAEPIFSAPVAGIHAEEIETSMQLFLNPEHVTGERVDYAPPVGREFLDYAFMPLISPDGVWGYATYGEAWKGEAAIAAQVQSVVAFARHAFARLDDVDQR
jgi:creatinine amidohydrolase